MFLASIGIISIRFEPNSFQDDDTRLQILKTPVEEPRTYQNKAESMTRCGSFKNGDKTGTTNWRPYVSGVRKKKRKLNKITSSGFRLGVDASGRQPTSTIPTGYPMWMSDFGFRHAGLLGSDLDIFHQGKGFQGSLLIM